MRMTGTSLDCYKYLEPLLNDYRKVRVQNKQGGKSVLYMIVEFITFRYPAQVNYSSKGITTFSSM